MRVSIVNLNLEGRDAIGQSILNQVRMFQRRGDEVAVYLVHPPRHVPLTVTRLAQVVGPADLVEGGSPQFTASDLYVYHYPGRYPLLNSIKTLERGAVIFYYHNVTPPELWGSPFEADVLRDSVQKAGTFAHYADWVVTDSEFNATQLVRNYGLDRERIRVLPLAVALDQFAPGPKPRALLKRYGLLGQRVILFVGRMAGNKRIDLLVEALAVVRQVVPNAMLVLVGDDRGNLAIQENVERARRRAADLNVADAVIFTGLVDSLPEFYRMADVYATASLHEGFGVPLIEAMACAVPVVASRATAHPEVVGEAGLLCEPEDAADLAAKLVQVLTDDTLCGQLVQRGLARAREFSLESYEEGWARIVAEATAWLPDRPYPRMRRVHLGTVQTGEEKPTGALGEDAGLEALEGSADVMMRGYVVRSGLPVVGPLVAWVRRNLTSHLREPYLDPTLERQVGFNQRAAQALRRLESRLAAYEMQEDGRELRMAQMGAELDLLAAQVSRLELLNAESPDRGKLDELKERIAELRSQLGRRETTT
jgi:glycosyltransferase involved in cell wall biosynthesis